jgi:hypothetical protein
MKAVLLKNTAALLLLVFLAGCMNFDYVGQSFAPKSESAVVNIFNGREKLPADKYRIIGRGTLTGPLSTDEYDRLAELRSLARKHGADAVCILSAGTKAVGYYPQSKGAFAPPLSSSANVDNLNSRGEAWQMDSFGQVQTLTGREKVRYDFVLRILLLKDTADFNAEMKERTPIL